MSKISQSEALQIILDVWQDISQEECVDEAQAMRYALESVHRVAKVFEQAALKSPQSNLLGFDEVAPFAGNKKRLKSVPESSEVRFVREWQMGNTRYPFGPCGGTDLWRAYAKWCAQQGYARPRAANMFLKYVSKLPGWESKPCHRYENTHYQGSQCCKRMVMPSGLSQPEGKTKSQWLTDCHFAFTAALRASEHAA